MRLTVTGTNTGNACQDPTAASANLFMQSYKTPRLWARSKHNPGTPANKNATREWRFYLLMKQNYG